MHVTMTKQMLAGFAHTIIYMSVVLSQPHCTSNCIQQICIYSLLNICALPQVFLSWLLQFCIYSMGNNWSVQDSSHITGKSFGKNKGAYNVEFFEVRKKNEVH